MHAYITLDVDPDFECKSNAWENARKGIEVCLSLFKKYSIEEKITWFVNNAELELTSKRSKYLEKIGDGEIALHMHLDRPEYSGNYYYLPEDEAKIFSALKKEKEKLEKWTLENLGREIISFRSGDLLSSNKLFYALNKLGIRIDSSIPSQFDFSFKEMGRKILSYMPLRLKLLASKLMVNKRAYPTLPLGKNPFKIGNLIEMPVHVYAGGSNLKDNGEWIKRRTKLQIEKGVKELVIYWHPHEILKKEKIFENYIEYLLALGLKFRKISEYIGQG